MRLDKALAALFPDFSRSTLQKWLKQGLIVVDDEIPSQREPVQGGEQIELAVPDVQAVEWHPEPVEINVVYEDEHLIVIDKPAGLVVHPGAGNPDATLVNGLLNFDASLSALPRAGIVHRLDKDTTGLMVVSRTETARRHLIEQLSRRTLGRTYLAVVQGVPVSGGRVDEPIGRDRNDRRRMAVATAGKPAVTNYRVERRYRAQTLLQCALESGRTHQIRVHMRHVGHPLVGDPVYGGRSRLPPASTAELRETLQKFNRQALHAWKLRLHHPDSGDEMSWQSPLPADMDTLCRVLAQDRDAANAG